MPDLDGIETAKIIREEIGSDYAKNIPIIALTANAIAGNERMFLNEGFQAFISKPIELEHLDSVINEWVRDRELETIISERQNYPDVRERKDTVNEAETNTIKERLTAGIKIEGLDIDKGIGIFVGDEDSYLQVLRSYTVNTKPLLIKASEPDMSNLKNYAIIVHGIKGSSRNICAETIGKMAEALEYAAKDANVDYIRANNTGFIKATEDLIQRIEGMLKQISKENPKPKKDILDKALLEKLLEACKAYDMDGIDAAMSEIEKFEYECDDGLAHWLRENVEAMNFSQIDAKLSELFQAGGEKNG